MKRKFLAGSLLLLMAAFLVSCSESDNDTLFNNIKERLALTPDQVTQVRPVFDDQIAKAREIIKEEKQDNKPGSQFDYSKVLPTSSETVSVSEEAAPSRLVVRLRELGKETGQKLIPILSAQQLEEYEKMVREEIARIAKGSQDKSVGQRKHNRGGFGGMGGYGGGFH